MNNINRSIQRLRFLHIPKTAGSTFISILERRYQGKKIFAFTGDISADKNRFEMLSTQEKEQILLFIGHAPITSGIEEADTATIITFLRDPINRVISFCQHVAAGKSPYLRKDFPPASFDLDRFLESGNSQLELSNLQTKMLINSGRNATPTLIDTMSAAEARDKALDNLFNKITCFGLQEFFDESLTYIGAILGWKTHIYYITLNKHENGKSIKIEKRHLQRIEELNAIDIEVYKNAKEQFMNILERPDFDKLKLWKFRLMNTIASPLLSIKRKIVK